MSNKSCLFCSKQTQLAEPTELSFLHYIDVYKRQVYNWDMRYYGNITMQYAIQESRNVPAVKTLEAVGLKQALKFLNKIGINYPEMHYSNAISSNTNKSGNEYGASSEKMAAAYAAFANEMCIRDRLTSELGTNFNVTSFHFSVNCFSDIVKETSPACQSCIFTKFTSNDSC